MHSKSTYLLRITIVTLALLLSLNCNSVFATDADSPAMRDMLPRFEDFEWTYLGLAGYGHDMRITSLVNTGEVWSYTIEGQVHDLSGGEADADFSLVIQYDVQTDVWIQEKEEEAMLASPFERLELLRTPIVKGNSWTQQVAGPAGEVTLECTIVDVDVESGARIYTVMYEDVGGDYYEIRELQEHMGIIAFKRLIYGEDDTHEVGYHIEPNGTGVDIDLAFADVEREDWFRNDLTPLVVLELFEGYPDGFFRPEREMTVAEFTKLMVLALSYDAMDEGDLWYQGYVQQAIALDLMSSDDFVNFDRAITREEMAQLISRGLKARQSYTLDFIDEERIGDAYRADVETAVALGIIAGYPDGTFRPEQPMIRAEAAKVLRHVLERVREEPLGPEDALVLEEEFEERLYQETEPDEEEAFDRVKDFSSKEALVEHLSRIMVRDLAREYVDEFYQESGDHLYLIPRDGAAKIAADVEFELRRIHPRKKVLVQEHWSGLVGDYRLIITYEYREERWMMAGREVEGV